MAETKYANIRYRVLDACFRDFSSIYYIEDLIEACEDAIYDYCGETKSCSRRTIMSDIQFMEDKLGWEIPLQKIRNGHRVYYRYESPDFSIYKSDLSESDYEKLNEVVLMLERFKGMPCFEWIDEILVKLKRGFRNKNQAVIELEDIHTIKGLDYIERLFNAILNKEVLSIKYETFAGAQFDWIIHPYIIKEYNKRWFLFGLNDTCGNAISTIPLDRIKGIRSNKAKYIPNDGTLNKKLKEVIGVTIDWKADVERVKIKVSEKRFPYIITKPLHKSQTVVDEKERIIQIEVIPNKELEMTILQFGADIEVLEPESFRQQIIDIIEKIRENY